MALTFYSRWLTAYSYRILLSSLNYRLAYRSNFIESIPPHYVFQTAKKAISSIIESSYLSGASFYLFYLSFFIIRPSDSHPSICEGI